MVIIELGRVDYSVEELKNSIEQKHYTNNSSAKELIENASKKTKIKNYIKEWFPLISISTNNVKQLKTQEKFNQTKKDIDIEEYSKILDTLLQKIKSEYNGKIVFLYHPNNMTIGEDEVFETTEVYEAFSKVVQKNGIDIIDMTEPFLEQYNKYSQVPYGFWNTQMGIGHLNRIGHKLIAEEVYKYIEEMN